MIMGIARNLALLRQNIGTSCAGGLGGTAPQKLTQYIKVNFSNLLNS